MPLSRLPTRADLPTPPRPEFFDERYTLPEHDATLPLTLRNAHPLDARLAFLEKPHVYLLDGKPVSDSVTHVAHLCQESFDADAAIAGMKRSTKEAWPKLRYAKNAELVARLDDLTAADGVLLVVDEVAVAASRPHDFRDAASGEALVDAILACHAGAPALAKLSKRDAAGRPAGLRVYRHDGAMTDEEIKASWEANGEQARNRGTEAHLQMQYAVEGMPFRADDAEVQVGLRFLDRFPDEWAAYRAEWEIVAPDLDLAGSIDLVVRRGDEGEIVIVDYKRSDKLQDRMHGFRRMRPPLNHLDDCDGAGYALQLSIYQYILEAYYGMRVADRILLNIHDGRPYATATPYLRAEVELLMRRRRAEVEARAEAKKRGLLGECALTGQPLYDPVRAAVTRELQVQNVNRKAALAHEWAILGEDEEAAAKAREAIASCRADADAPTAPWPAGVPKTAWKALMPKEGMVPSVFA